METANRREQLIRAKLESVALVGELGSEINPEAELYKMALANIQDYLSQTNGYRPKEIRKRSFDLHGSLIVLLVSDGIYKYKSGEFWPNTVFSRWISDPNDSTALGKSFLTALDNLDLDTFSYVQRDEKALKYVMPILLHGMIPHQCADDYWGLLARSLSQSEPNPTDIRAYWLRSPSRFEQGVDKPVQRFLRHGGSLADDLLERSIDFAEHVNREGREEVIHLGSERLAEEFGLDIGLVASYFDRKESTLRINRGPRVPSPYVYVTPWDGQGPKLFLPPTPKFHNASWVLISGGKKETIDASPFSDREIPLPVRNRWTLRFHSDERSQEFSFSGHGYQNVYFFEDHQPYKLVRDHDRLRSASVIALSPPGISFCRPPDNLNQKSDRKILQTSEQFPEIGGSWSNYHLQKFNLDDVRKFEINNINDSDEKDVVVVQSEIARPVILGDVITGVNDLDGRMVFGSPPRVFLQCQAEERDQWRFKLVSHGKEICSGSLDELNWYKENEFDFGNINDRWNLQEFELTIRGKLGSDLREEFVVIPGTKFDRPDKLLSVSETADVEFISPGNLVNNEKDASFLHFSEKVNTVRFPISEIEGEAPLELQASLARIRWGITEVGETAFHDYEVKSISLEDLAVSKKTLDLVLGKPESVTLYLAGEHGEPIHRKQVDIENQAGRWPFHLVEFYDSAARAGLQKLELKLETDFFVEHLANIFATYEVSNVRVHHEYDSGFCYLNVEWDERLPFKNRELRIWSRHRPWERPITKKIPDGASCSIEHSFDTTPGSYLVEIGINDGFVSVSYPLESFTENSGMQVVAFGTHIEQVNYLESLDPASDSGLLELISSNHNVVNISEQVHSLDDGWEDFLSLLRVRINEIEKSGGKKRKDAVRAFNEAYGQLMRENLDHLLVEFLTSDDRAFNRKLLFTFFPEIVRSPTIVSTDQLESIWESFMIAGASIDNFKTNETNTHLRWERYTGYLGEENAEESFIPGAPKRVEEDLPSTQLHKLTDYFHDSRKLVLTSEGWVHLMLTTLIQKTENPDLVKQVGFWRTKWSNHNDQRVRNGDKRRELHLARLEKNPGSDSWTSFFQELLAWALTLIDGRRDAARALYEADKIAEDLVDWAVVLAVMLWMEDDAV